MSEGNPPRPDDLHDLEPLEPAPLTPIPPPPAPSAAQRTAAPARGKGRELERAPLMLRKAASILIFASLLPWMREGGFDLMVIVAKVVVLAGGGILYYSVLARHGEPVPGPFAALAKSHNRALDVLGWLVILAGVLPLIDGGTRGEVVGAAVEKGALAIGLAVFMQILDYEKGGKLNPALGLMIPLVGVGALGRLATLFKEFDALALLGCLGIVAAAGVAGRTLQVAMKEAKAHGEAKKQAAVEARKAARTQQRAARGTGEAGGASPEPKRGE
jgi:hypothetical protein